MWWSSPPLTINLHCMGQVSQRVNASTLHLGRPIITIICHSKMGLACCKSHVQCETKVALPSLLPYSMTTNLCSSLQLVLMSRIKPPKKIGLRYENQSEYRLRSIQRIAKTSFQYLIFQSSFFLTCSNWSYGYKLARMFSFILAFWCECSVDLNLFTALELSYKYLSMFWAVLTYFASKKIATLVLHL